MDEAIAVPCPACRSASEAASPGRWLCRGCGQSGFLRRCAVCGLVSYVDEAQEWHQPWQCMWCRESNTAFTRYCDPATATLAELAGALRRYRPGCAAAGPPAGRRPVPPARAESAGIGAQAVPVSVAIGAQAGPESVAIGAQAVPVSVAIGAQAGPESAGADVRPITAAKMQAIPAVMAAAEGAAAVDENVHRLFGLPSAGGAVDSPPSRRRKARAARRRRRGRAARQRRRRPGRRGLRAVALAVLVAAITTAMAFLVIQLARSGLPEQTLGRPSTSFQDPP